MKGTMSRYGGHGFIIGKGKASSVNLPEEQSLEKMLDNQAFEMKGFSYLSSYEMMPEFMGAYNKLPSHFMKLADMEHTCLEVFLQYDVELQTSIYVGGIKYANVFGCFIKTDFEPLELSLGKFSPSYDLVLVMRVEDKTEEEIIQLKSKIFERLICLLVYEMGLTNLNNDITASRTAVGKKLNMNSLDELLGAMKDVENREQLADVLEF